MRNAHIFEKLKMLGGYSGKNLESMLEENRHKFNLQVEEHVQKICSSFAKKTRDWFICPKVRR